MKKSRTIFVSDLHLCPSEPRLGDLFLQFLSTEAIDCDALYILGDFFEAWAGDDNPSSFSQDVIKGLHEFSQTNTPCYFIHGNRDFLIGKQFSAETGVHILNDPTAITLYGKNYLICHGDYLCIDDVSHQRFRKVYLNTFNQKLFLSLPKNWRRKVATKARKESSRRHKTSKGYKGGINYEYAISQAQTHNCDTLIHGHTHKPIIDKIKHENKSLTRVTLPAWEDTPGYLEVTEERIQLKNIHFA